MLVDLKLAGKNALIIAEGSQAEIRAKQLLSEGANVTVLTCGAPTEELRRASSLGELNLRKESKDKWRSILKDMCPFLSVISTGNAKKDEVIAEYARTTSRLIYVVDRPSLNDLNMTGVAKIGDIRVAVSTRGLSPAMAGLLRRKIESLIDKEEILQVRLQGEVRSEIKRSIKDPSQRKKLIYRLIRDKRIFSLLKSDRFEDAKHYA
ncbi:MAG: precorrin-2 dehydrogenase/sirohydrochlorin ferrochelatase family protein, partial [Nitrososphaerales archaeon]